MEKISGTIFFRPAAAFLLLCAAVLVLRGNYIYAGGNYSAALVIVFIFLFASSLSGDYLKKTVRKSIVFSLTLVSLYAAAQYLGVVGEFSRIKEAGSSSIIPYATFGNRVYLADYILLTIPFAFSFLKENKIRGGICLFAALGALALSGASRVLPGLFVISFVYFLYSRGKARRTAGLVMGIIIFAGGFFIYDRGRNIAKESIAPRLMVWRVSRDMFLSRPLTGAGIGLFSYEYPLYQEEFFRKADNLKYVRHSQRSLPLRAQSEPVQLLVETGIIGFLIVAYIFFVWFKKAEKDREFGLPALAGAAALLMSSLIAFPFHRPGTALTLALVMGLASPGGEKRKQELKSSVSGFVNKVLIVLALFLISFKAAEQILWEKGRRAFREKNYAASVDYLEPSESFSYLAGEMLFLRGRAWNRRGFYHVAEEEYRIAEKTYRHSALYYSRALVLIRMRDFSKAEKYLKKAIYTTPKLEKPFNILIELYINAGRPDLAAEYKIMMNNIREQMSQ